MKTKKVNAQYRLPVQLFKRVQIEAVHRGVRTSAVVEAILSEGLGKHRASEPELEPEAAAAP